MALDKTLCFHQFRPKGIKDKVSAATSAKAGRRFNSQKLTKAKCTSNTMSLVIPKLSYFIKITIVKNTYQKRNSFEIVK